MPSKYTSGLLQSDQQVSYPLRRVEKSGHSSSSSTTSSPIVSTLLSASPHGFSGFRSTAFSLHSKSVQTNRGQAFFTGGGSMAVMTTAAATRPLRNNALEQWPQRSPTNVPSTTPDGHLLSAHDVTRLPPPRQVQQFVDYINPYIKQNINPLQVIDSITYTHCRKSPHSKNSTAPITMTTFQTIWLCN